MAPRTTARRSAGHILAVALIAMVAASPIAFAQSGNGLYEPFPEAAVKKRAQRYVERLGARMPEDRRRFSDAELAAGTFVAPHAGGPSLAPAGGAASRRAGAEGSADLSIPLQLLLTIAVLALPAGARVNGRRTRAA